jgi:hypothetical protein
MRASGSWHHYAQMVSGRSAIERRGSEEVKSRIGCVECRLLTMDLAANHNVLGVWRLHV